MMKHLMMTMVAVAVAAGAAAQPAPAEQVVASYLEVQAALANDSLEGVPAAARQIAAQAAGLGSQGEPVVKAARELTSAADIKAARAAFGPLSEAVIALVRANPSAHDVKLAYCPMAKASWLQKEEKIRNPYYGSSMLACGEFRPIEKRQDPPVRTGL